MADPSSRPTQRTGPGSVFPPDPFRLGGILVERGLVAAADLADALRVQALLSLDLPAPLGELLLRRGLATESQVRDALAAQDVSVLQCPRCPNAWNVRDYSPTRPVPCPACREPRLLPAPAGVIRVSGTVLPVAGASAADGAPAAPAAAPLLPASPPARAGRPSPTDATVPDATGDRRTSDPTVLGTPRRLSDLPLPLPLPLTGATPSPPEPPVASPQGEPFGRYRLLKELGRGGMGIVYRAWDGELKRLVALKTLRFAAGPAPAPAGTTGTNPFAPTSAEVEEVERFLREARAAGRLRHPGIVAVHDVGALAGRHYLTMDYIEGESLESALPRLDPRRCLEVLRDVARALHAAHEAGVVHRDVKPANILLDGSDRPFVSDFGLAKVLKEPDARKLTLSGTVMGTPHFMAPEQAAGDTDRIGPASDLWSLGVILYQHLTGRMPFDADRFVDILGQIIRAEPVRPARAAARAGVKRRVPPDLETICLKCLEKDPARRYASAAALADELDRYLAGEPILARPLGRVGRMGRWAMRRPAAAAALLAFTVLVPALGISLWWNERQSSARARRARAEPHYLRGRTLFDQALQDWRDVGLRWAKRRLQGGAMDRRAFEELAEQGLRRRAVLQRAARAALDAAIAEDPGFADALAARAALGDLEGDSVLAAALRDAEQAVAADPGHFGARYLRAMINLRQYESRRGSPFYLDILAPRAGDASRSVRTVQIRKKAETATGPHPQRVAAAADFAALRRQPGAPESLCAPGEAALLFLAGDFAAADQAIQRPLEENPYDFRTLFWAVRIATAVGARQRARDLCDDLVLLRPDSPITRRARGWVLILDGQPDLALEELEQALRLPAEKWYLAPVHAARAAVFEMQGRLKEAAEDLEVALRDGFPEDRPGVYNERAQVRAEQGDRAGALEDYGRALAERPDDPVLLYNRGRLLKQMGNLKRARADLDRAIAADPSRGEAWFLRWGVRQLGGDVAGGRADLEEALRRDPQLAEGYNDRALLREQDGNADGALADYQRAIEADVGLRDPYYNRALLRSFRGESEAAIRDLDAALRCSPGWVAALVARANSRCALGQKDAALADAEAALAVPPRSAPALLARARVRMLKPRRDFKAAAEDLDAALALDPTPLERTGIQLLQQQVKLLRASFGDTPGDDQ